MLELLVMTRTTAQRDAAVAAVQAARRRMAEHPPGTPAQTIARRMLVDANEAVLVGVGELQDLHGDAGVSGEVAIRTLAGTLASLAMTLANADEAKALAVLPMMVGELGLVAQERVLAYRAMGYVTDVLDDIEDPA